MFWALLLVGLIVPAQNLRAAAPEQGTAALEESVRQNPDAVAIRVRLGKAYYHEGRYRDAAKQWNHILKNYQATIAPAARVKLCVFIATALLKDGDRAKAEVYAAKARAESPTDAAVVKLMGLIQAGTIAKTQPPPTQPSPAPSAQPSQEAPTFNFVRVRDLGKGLKALETESLVFESPDGKLKVILDGTIHLGEPAYYKQIQASLDSTERVLFEAVIMQPSDLEEFGKPNEGDQAQKMAPACGLVAQTLSINYKRPNFIWADITLPDLLAYQHSRAFLEVVQDAARDAARAKAKAAVESDDAGEDLSESDLRELMNAPPDPKSSRAKELRRRLAQSLVRAGDIGGLGMPAPVQELILYRRNDYVMQALHRQIRKKSDGSISIYYGAAHMPDLARRLWELGYRPGKAEWREAWTFQ